jgi:nucleotide-binding universal stress UspA family protein
MKKILLPTDFSENAWNSVQYALELFKNQKCVFYLLNTYTSMIYNIEYFETGIAQAGLIDAMKESSKNRLDKLLIKINDQFKNENHTFGKISSFNTLVNEIEELHQGNVIDFIIMGTQGASGIKEVLFGSNTIHVIKNAKCPVLAIPNDFPFESPHEILFPSDYEIDFQDNHIQPIIDLTSSYNARVNIINASFGYDLSEKQEQNRQKLEVYFKHTAHLFHSVSNQNVTQAITNFQLRARINLLVMINNKHSFFENLFFKSKINQIGFHLNIPFLVIPS